VLNIREAVYAHQKNIFYNISIDLFGSPYNYDIKIILGYQRTAQRK
jgi:hypothetical protein